MLFNLTQHNFIISLVKYTFDSDSLSTTAFFGVLDSLTPITNMDKVEFKTSELIGSDDLFYIMDI